MKKSAESDFTVLIPVYDQEDPRKFHNALESIFDNSLQPAEVLVVCDGPLTAELNNVLNAFNCYSYLKILRLPVNGGIVVALNKGLELIKTPIVVRCDSDDVNHRDRFAHVIKELQNGSSVVGSQIDEVDESNNKLPQKLLPVTHDEIVTYAQKRNPLNHMTVGFWKVDVLAAGGYPNIYMKEDYALWVTMLGRNFQFHNINRSLVTVTAGNSMLARRGGLKASWSEIRLQHKLVKSGISSLPKAFLYGTIRFLLLISPISIRAWFYRKVLRK